MSIFNSKLSFLPWQYFLALDALFEGGRMFVGATSVTYLLGQGISLSQIASLKIIQAVTIIFAEVPTGIFADTFGRKTSLIAATMTGIVGFFFFFFGKNLAFFIFAEICCALSICFWSGAYESYVIEYSKLKEKLGLLDQFFYSNQMITSVSVMVCGLAGGLLGSYGYRYPYLGAVAAFLIILLILVIVAPADRNYSLIKEIKNSIKTELLRHFNNSFKEGLLHPNLWPIFLAEILIQFSIQPILHYWQPLFQAISPNMTSSGQGVVFVSYCGANFIFGLIYSRISKEEWSQSLKTTLFLFSTFGAVYFILPHTSIWILTLLLFCLAQGCLSSGRSSLRSRLNKNIESDSRATILSSVSLFSRFGMLIALLGLRSYFTVNSSSNIESVRMLYEAFGATTLGFCGVFGWFLMKQKNKEVIIYAQ